AASELSLVEYDAGDDRLAVAERLVEEGLRMVTQSRESMATSMLLGVESALRLRRGEMEAAIAKARESYDVARGAGNAVIKLWSLPHLIAAYSVSGDRRRAL